MANLSGLQLKKTTGDINFSIMDDLADAIVLINENVIPNHDPTLAYAENQIVSKNGAFFRANSAIPADTVFVEGVAALEWTRIGAEIPATITDKDTTSATSSTTFVDMANMTKTPTIAGTYLAQFSATVKNSNADNSVTVQIADGNDAVVNASLREISCKTADEKLQVNCFGIVTVDGETAIKVIWKVAGGTGTVFERQLLLIRIA